MVKCSGGQDRTGLAAALYLLHGQGWAAVDAARAQFARWPFLHLPKDEQRWLAQFVVFAETSAMGRPVAQWIRDSYTPEAFRDWLEAHGHAASFRAIFEKRAAAHRWQW